MSLQMNETVIIDESQLLLSINKQLNKIPKPNKELMPGIKWGYYGKLFTPAYWKAQYLMFNQNENYSINYKLGENILEEVIACLLGGFGLKAEIGLAAFERMKSLNLIHKGVKYEQIHRSLKKPFLNNEKKVHYRFPNQKAKYIAAFLNRDDLDSIPTNNDINLRDWLLSINGIGPKTAAWITRNHLNSEKVAIIDVHIYRACLMMGLYPEYYDIQKDYTKLEEIFLDFCKELDVQPSKMDALIWLQMKASNRSALKIINNK